MNHLLNDQTTLVVRPMQIPLVIFFTVSIHVFFFIFIQVDMTLGTVWGFRIHGLSIWFEECNDSGMVVFPLGSDSNVYGSTAERDVCTAGKHVNDLARKYSTC